MNLHETYNVFYATWQDFSLFVCSPRWRSFLPLSLLALTNLGILQFIQNRVPPRLIALSNTGKSSCPSHRALCSGFRWANLLTLSKYNCSTRCSYRTLHVILKSSLIIVGPLCLLYRWLTRTRSFHIMQLRTLWSEFSMYGIYGLPISKHILYAAKKNQVLLIFYSVLLHCSSILCPCEISECLI